MIEKFYSFSAAVVISVIFIQYLGGICWTRDWKYRGFNPTAMLSRLFLSVLVIPTGSRLSGRLSSQLLGAL